MWLWLSINFMRQFLSVISISIIKVSARTLNIKLFILYVIGAGLLKHDSSWDFLEIALLVCFCAIHNHGFEMLFSFSAIVQHTPSPPVGFSILKAGLSKSVLLSVYASSKTKYSHDNPSYGIISSIFSNPIVWLCVQLQKNSELVSNFLK